MAYFLEYCPECKKEIKKLCRNNWPLREALEKKVDQILETPHHFKPLKKPLQNQRRVHILNCFILKIMPSKKTMAFMPWMNCLDHHIIIPRTGPVETPETYPFLFIINI